MLLCCYDVNPAPYKGQQISEFQSRLTQFYMKCNTGAMSALAVLAEAYPETRSQPGFLYLGTAEVQMCNKEKGESKTSSKKI